MTNQTGYPYEDQARDNNTTFSNSEAKKTAPQTAHNVYLKPGGNHSWYALIQLDPASKDDAIFCTEGDYPVEVTYRRTDINGSICYDTCSCCDREDLLQTLDWLGTCGFIPCQVWNFDIEKDIDPALYILFNKAYNHRLQNIQKIADDIYAEEGTYEDELSTSDSSMKESLSRKRERLEGDYQLAFRPLNEQINTASSFVTEADFGKKLKEMNNDKDSDRFFF